MTGKRSGRMVRRRERRAPPRVHGRLARRPRGRTDSERLEAGCMAVRSANRMCALEPSGRRVTWGIGNTTTTPHFIPSLYRAPPESG